MPKMTKYSRIKLGILKVFFGGTYASPAEDRFWANVDKNGSVPIGKPVKTPCWRWSGGKDHDGYAKLYFVGRDGRRLQRASQFSWELHNHGRRIKRGMQIRHHCDNPECTNPEHLLIGTNGDNKKDAMSRDRHAKGERHGRAKLSNAHRLKILRLYATGSYTQQQLAEMTGVDQTTVSRVIRGETWRV